MFQFDDVIVNVIIHNLQRSSKIYLVARCRTKSSVYTGYWLEIPFLNCWKQKHRWTWLYIILMLSYDSANVIHAMFHFLTFWWNRENQAPIKTEVMLKNIFVQTGLITWLLVRSDGASVLVVSQKFWLGGWGLQLHYICPYMLAICQWESRFTIQDSFIHKSSMNKYNCICRQRKNYWHRSTILNIMLLDYSISMWLFFTRKCQDQ